MIRIRIGKGNVALHFVHAVGVAINYLDAARLLAGLEVAVAAALREAGRGKCLRCGKVQQVWTQHIFGREATHTHCRELFGMQPCRGILAPVGDK